MKRFACCIVAICFMIGFFPAACFTASAEEPVKLRNVSLDFDLPAAGNSLPDAFTISQGYVIEQWGWEIYRDGAWHALTAEEALYADDQTYRLQVWLVCAPGYCIDYESFPSGYLPGTVNGESVQAAFYGGKDDQKNNQWKGVVIEKIIFGSAVPAVKTIDVSGIPMQSGDVFTAQQIVLGNDRVSVRSCQINVNGEAVESVQLDYGWYNIHIDLSVAEGYVLNPEKITVNGLPITECGWDIACGFDVGEGWISLSCEREPEGYIDAVTIGGAPSEILADTAIEAPELSVKWSNHGIVSVASAQWVDANYVPVTGNFATGNVYYLAITLQTDSEVPFRDFFNLELLDENDDYHCVALATSGNAKTAVAYIRYALLPSLEDVHIQLTQPAVGLAPEMPTVAADALFTVESVEWIDMATMASATVFEDGHSYQLRFQIKPVEGYQLQVGSNIFVNDVAAQTVTDPEVQLVTVFFSFMKPVERVEITVDEPSDYLVPGIPGIIANDLASIISYRWINGQTGELAELFVPGNRYYLEVDIQVAQGYHFTAETEFLLNGQSVKVVLIDNTASLRVTFDMVQRQTEVVLQGIPDAVIPGQSIDLSGIGIVGPHSTIGDIYWLNEDKEPFDGVMEEGNIYYLAIVLHADPLTPFAQFVSVNGPDGPLTEAISDDGLVAVAYLRYSLLAKVDLAEVTVDLPQLGQAPAVPSVGVDAGYSILSFSWKDMATNESVSIFEEGHRYVLTVTLCPNDGMEFGQLQVLYNGQAVELTDLNSAYAAFTVEYSFRSVLDRIDLFAPELSVGMEVKPSDIVVLTDGVTLHAASWINAVTFEELNGIVGKALYTLRASVRPMDGFEFGDHVQIYLNGQLLQDTSVSIDSAGCSVSYDLRDVITDIQISGMPQISVGGATESVTMAVPDGAPYTVQTNWLLYGGDYQFAGPGAVFEEGKVYYLEILVKPAAGFRIADDAVILVDGAAFAGITMTGDIGIWLYKQYNCGLQVIDRVDLNVSVPIAGMLPGAVTIPEGSCVSLRDFTWAYCESGLFADAVDLLEGDIFEPGFHYMISGALVADKGYVFAENLLITVNGVPTNIDLGDLGVINLGDTAFLGHSFGLLQQVQTPDPTGDSIGVVLAMMLVSVAAWLTMKRKK